MYYLFLPVAIAASAVLFLILLLLKKFNIVRFSVGIKSAVCGFVLTTAVSLAFFTFFNIMLGMIGVKTTVPSAFIAAVLSLGANLAFADKFGVEFSNSGVGSSVKTAAKSALIIVLLECTLFNISSFSSMNNKPLSLDLTSAYDINDMSVLESGLTVNQSNNAEFTLKIPPVDINSVSVRLSDNDGEPKMAEVSFLFKDANISSAFVDSSSAWVKVNGKDEIVKLKADKISELKVKISGADEAIIDDITLDPIRPFSVSIFRVLALMFILTAAIFIKKCRLHDIKINKKSIGQFAVAMIAMCCCLAVCITLFAANADSAFEDYDISVSPLSKAPYHQLFDAFQKGQLNLDVPVDERLIEAGDKAYDTSYLMNNAVSFEWDRAYYNGKYYVYFGVAPEFLLYYPTYLLTHKLPSNQTAVSFFAMLCVIFSFMLIFKIANTVAKRPNYLITLLCAVAFSLSSGILLLCTFGDFYSIPILCGIAFLLLLTYFTIGAYSNPRWYFCLACGVCASIVAASRPTLIIMCLSLAPFYIGILTDKKHNAKNKLLCVLAFAIPVMITAAGLMAYNYIRFDSVFEFGAKYQLTVSDISYNTVSFSMLMPAIYYYFFEPVGVSGTFPQIAPRLYNIGNVGRYFYNCASFGLFNFPIMWSAVLYPSVVKKTRLDKKLKAFVGATIGLSVVIAFLDFSLAGVNLRYLADIAPMFCVAAAVLLIVCEERMRNRGYGHKLCYFAIVLLLLSSIIIGFFLLLSTEPCSVRKSCPELFDLIYSAFKM